MAGVLFAFSMKLNSMAIANIAWIAISVLFVTTFDYLYFKEALSFLQLSGLVIVLIGFVMVNIGSK